jgi:hypothetical protein
MKYQMKKLTYIFTLSILVTIPIKSQTFVKIEAQGANNGTSWNDAYVNLDSALIKTSNGEIWVAAGTYKPSVDINTSSKKYKTFNINKKIALYGGFSGIENNINQRDINKNLTILSGDIGVAGNNADNTPTVVSITGSNIDSSTILDGFTITKASFSYGYDYESGAVKILCIGNPVIRNCTIKGNFGYYGGGIYVGKCDAKIIDNLICNNVAFEGAGIYNDDGADSKIINNKILNNQCMGGYTHLAGGGIKIDSYCAPLIYGNLIDNNYSGTCGGGISVETNYSAIIANNIISNNRSGTGGGIYIDYTPTQIANNLITRNIAQYGGGIYVNNSYNTNSVNNTIVKNESQNAGSAVYLVNINMHFINTIIFNNRTPTNKSINVNNSDRSDRLLKFEYCDIENGKNSIAVNMSQLLDSLWKSGNISETPDFIDSEYNFQLNKKSSCINAGIPDTTGLEIFSTDLLGNNRIQYNRIDIGCYELDSLINHFLLVSIDTLFVSSIGNNNLSFNINSNLNWLVSSNLNWISLDRTSGSNSDKITLNVSANNTSNYRNGIIKVYSFIGGNEISKTIVIAQQPISTGINEVKESDIKLFPNPIINNLTILLSNPKYHEVVSIYSLNGYLLYTSKVSSSQISIDMSRFNSGCYLLIIASPNDKITYKLLKQ